MSWYYNQFKVICFNYMKAQWRLYFTIHNLIYGYLDFQTICNDSTWKKGYHDNSPNNGHQGTYLKHPLVCETWKWLSWYFLVMVVWLWAKLYQSLASPSPSSLLIMLQPDTHHTGIIRFYTTRLDEWMRNPGCFETLSQSTCTALTAGH